MSGLFISYRRADSGGQVGRLVDRLVGDPVFRHGGIFVDVNPGVIELGENFRERIRAAIGLSNVVLAVIGNQWLTIQERGRRRLDIADDAVREELAYALQRGVTVIPMLVGNTAMPAATDLPDPLRRLANLNGTSISDARFDLDLGPLVEKLKRLCQDPAAAPPAEVSAQTYAALGLDRLREKDLENAKASFAAAIRQKPDFGAAYIHLAHALQLEGFDRITENNYGLALERLASAKQALNDAFPYVEADAGLLVQMGYIFKDFVQAYAPIDRSADAAAAYESARRHFELALGRDPKNASALNGLGSIAIALGDFDTGIERCRQAIALEPTYVSALHDLCLAYYGKARDERDPGRRLTAMNGYLDTWRRLIQVLAQPGSEQLPQKPVEMLQSIAGLISREVDKLERCGGASRKASAKTRPKRKPTAARGAHRKSGRLPKKPRARRR